MRNNLLLLALLVAAAGCGDGTAPEAAAALETGGVADATPATDSLLRASGGTSGAEYLLVPFYGAEDAGSRLQLTVTGTGTEAVAGATAAVALLAAPRFALLPGGSAGAATSLVRDAAFDRALRRRERVALAPRLGAARAALVPLSAASSSGARRLATAAVPLVGATLSLNVNAGAACTAPSYRAGRVAAVSERAVVVADAANPAGGFTDAEYAAIGAQFDSVVYPVDTRNFGAPTDIDDNGGRSVIFFTTAVNALTPRNSDSYVGGFFFGRDLFPSSECAASNRAEMFYMLAPDPSGAVNGNVRSKEFVRAQTAGVLAHEFQHLINESRRIYVNGASDYEEVWLDEGLSHVAEELLFYARSGLAPRANLTAAAIRASAAAVSAFNEDQASNIGRLREYLAAPEASSPYADDDSLATRGATWQFLRYAADQKGGDEAATWTALANSRTAGLANLRAVFGSDVLTQMRRWAVAQYADDAVAGAAAAYQQPSWSYRDLFAALGTTASGTTASGTSGAFPLATHALPSGTTLPLTLTAGGAAYVRFRVPANATAEVVVSGAGQRLPASLGVTLLRTQ